MGGAAATAGPIIATACRGGERYFLEPHVVAISGYRNAHLQAESRTALRLRAATGRPAHFFVTSTASEAGRQRVVVVLLNVIACAGCYSTTGKWQSCPAEAS